MEYYSAIKKNEIMSFAATWMELEIIILSKVSQKEKDKYHMISLICRILNMTQVNFYEAETDSQTQRTNLWLPRGREVAEGWSGSLGSADANYYI